MRLFADTSAWLNLYDRRAAAHTATQLAFEGLLRQRVALYVSDYVLDETLTIIRARVGHAGAVACGRYLLRSPAVRKLHLDQAQWEAAWEIFQTYDDKDFSFTDCTSFVLMRQHKIVEAFTSDHHFEQMGFRLWPR